MENIKSEGEYSLFYLGGEYSHAILKTPTDGDFRSQEEYGAQIKSVQPCESLLGRRSKRLFLWLIHNPFMFASDFVRVVRMTGFWSWSWS